MRVMLRRPMASHAVPRVGERGDHLNRFFSEKGLRIMRSVIKVTLISVMLITPALAFAQTVSTRTDNAPLTRAEVRADLVRVEQAGYRQNKTHYPADIQAAEAKLEASNGSGGVVAGTGESGVSVNATGASTTAQMLYRHH
jgi:uncharacterized protein DUF4148